MQGKYTIKRNTIKKVVKAKSSGSDEIISSSIGKKSISDEEVRINIITSARVDMSNSSRLLSPIDAEARNNGTVQRKRRRAVRNLTLKSAPPIPTAPKDPKARRKMWILSKATAQDAVCTSAVPAENSGIF